MNRVATETAPAPVEKLEAMHALEPPKKTEAQPAPAPSASAVERTPLPAEPKAAEVQNGGWRDWTPGAIAFRAVGAYMGWRANRKSFRDAFVERRGGLQNMSQAEQIAVAAIDMGAIIGATIAVSRLTRGAVSVFDFDGTPAYGHAPTPTPQPTTPGEKPADGLPKAAKIGADVAANGGSKPPAKSGPDTPGIPKTIAPGTKDTTKSYEVKLPAAGTKDGKEDFANTIWGQGNRLADYLGYDKLTEREERLLTRYILDYQNEGMIGDNKGMTWAEARKAHGFTMPPQDEIRKYLESIKADYNVKDDESLQHQKQSPAGGSVGSAEPNPAGNSSTNSTEDNGTFYAAVQGHGKFSGYMIAVQNDGDIEIQKPGSDEVLTIDTAVPKDGLTYEQYFQKIGGQLGLTDTEKAQFLTSIKNDDSLLKTYEIDLSKKLPEGNVNPAILQELLGVVQTLEDENDKSKPQSTFQPITEPGIETLTKNVGKYLGIAAVMGTLFAEATYAAVKANRYRSRRSRPSLGRRIAGLPVPKLFRPRRRTQKSGGGPPLS